MSFRGLIITSAPLYAHTPSLCKPHDVFFTLPENVPLCFTLFSPSVWLFFFSDYQGTLPSLIDSGNGFIVRMASYPYSPISLSLLTV